MHSFLTPNVIAGSLENLRQQHFGGGTANRANTPRTQSIINGNQRQLLHKLFSKGSFNYGSFSNNSFNAGSPTLYPPQQTAYSADMQQQYVTSDQQGMQQPMQQQSMQPSGYNPSGNLAMTDMQSALKPASAQHQQPMYHINALAYDHSAFARPPSVGMSREVALGQLQRGFSFGAQQTDDGNACGNATDNAGLEVLVTPNFSSQELNMLLDVSLQCMHVELCQRLPSILCSQRGVMCTYNRDLRCSTKLHMHL